MKNLKALGILAIVLSVVLVSGCSQPATNGTSASPATAAKAPEIKSAEQASKTVVDTSKQVTDISKKIADIDKSLSGG